MTKLIEVTVGPRDAHTDEESGLRFYNWRGVDYPSVTSIRRMAGLPHRLHQWTISQVVKRATEDFDTLTAMMTRERRPRERYDPGIQKRKRIKEASKWLRAAATEKRDQSAARGTAIHDAATKGLDPDTVDPELRPSLIRFYDWLESSGAEIIAVEQQVWNLSLGYAGTFDILCMIDGRVWVVDLKTGNGTYVDHVLQLIGYAMAEFVGTHGMVDPVLTSVLHHATGMALLHLTDDEPAHWEPIKVTPDIFEAFKGLLTYAKFVHQFADIEQLIDKESE